MTTEVANTEVVNTEVPSIEKKRGRLKSLPKSLRSLVDCFILFKPKSIIEVQSFADDVFALGKDDLKALFHFIFDEPYRFLFYNQRTNTYYKDFSKLVFSNT